MNKVTVMDDRGIPWEFVGDLTTNENGGGDMGALNVYGNMANGTHLWVKFRSGEWSWYMEEKTDDATE